MEANKFYEEDRPVLEMIMEQHNINQSDAVSILREIEQAGFRICKDGNNKEQDIEMYRWLSELGIPTASSGLRYYLSAMRLLKERGGAYLTSNMCNEDGLYGIIAKDNGVSILAVERAMRYSRKMSKNQKIIEMTNSEFIIYCYYENLK